MTHNQVVAGSSQARSGLLYKPINWTDWRKGCWNTYTSLVKMKEKKLIEILLDNSALDSDRDDAAMDLSIFDSDEVIDALIKVGKDTSVSNVILYSVGESIAQIWLRNENFEYNSYQDLCSTTKFAISENMDVIE